MKMNETIFLVCVTRDSIKENLEAEGGKWKIFSLLRTLVSYPIYSMLSREEMFPRREKLVL